MPREVCKQEALTLRVRSWRSCVLEGFRYEGHEEVWSEVKISTSLNWIVSHTREVWKHGLQIGVTVLIGRSSHIFHVLWLKKCLKAPMDVVLKEVAPLEADLMYPEHPIKILDQKDCVTRHKTIKFFKVH
jgi:hypothetical protein